jgi:hypothetical protein
MTLDNYVVSWDTANGATCTAFNLDKQCSNRTTKCGAGTGLGVKGAAGR